MSPVVVRALESDDLPACRWAGSPTHLGYVRQALDRAAAGEVDYLLIAALEEAARARGVRRVRLGVGDDNPRARRLYERLGYAATGEVEHGSYGVEDAHGVVTTVEASSWVLAKTLVP